MTQATAPQALATGARPAPPDLTTMRETARLLLGTDAAPGPLPVVSDDLAATHTEVLRGHLEVLVPELERVIQRLPQESISRYCALACIGEARGKLRAQAMPVTGGTVAYARRLARVLRALCDHYQALASDQPCEGA